MSEKTQLVLPGVEGHLAGIHIELCKGAGCFYVRDDKRIKGDLVLSVMVSRSGRVGGVKEFPYNHRASFGLRNGDDAIHAIEVMADYMQKHNRKINSG